MVNVASRMESNGVIDRIQVTAAAKEKLSGLYAFEEREPIPIKGKGLMVTYLLVRP
ncbi:MAG: adenylate/guanylate cyclase domain-containing protein [Candidatus Promineifilaceae bacterium]